MNIRGKRYEYAGYEGMNIRGKRYEYAGYENIQVHCLAVVLHATVVVYFLNVAVVVRVLIFDYHH